MRQISRLVLIFVLGNWRKVSVWRLEKVERVRTQEAANEMAKIRRECQSW